MVGKTKQIHQSIIENISVEYHFFRIESINIRREDIIVNLNQLETKPLQMTTVV